MNTWLNSPTLPQLDAAEAAQLPALPAPAAEDLVAAVQPGENDDPLVELPPSIAHLPVYDRLGLDGASSVPRLRSELVRRLLEAQDALPGGYALTVLDGWRTTEFQATLLAYYRKATGRQLDKYVSDPDDPDVIPPHTTGGAVDLTLSHLGTPLALGSDFDEFSTQAHLQAFEDLASATTPQAAEVRVLRRLLGAALTSAGLAPYPLEWWHWSYGEQRWAAQYGHSHSLYSVAS